MKCYNAMLYELRIYAIPPGRMRDIEHRMLVRVPPLFVRHGMRPVAHWKATAGTRLPAFAYLMEWKDAAQREAAWSSFYNDDDWWHIRADTDGGEELVHSYSLLLLAPDTAWTGEFDAGEVAADVVHDMVFSHVRIGRDAAIGEVFRKQIIPHFEARGGRIRGIFRVNSGPRIPCRVWFVSWSSFAERDRAWADYDTATLAIAQSGGGISDVGARDVSMMLPLSVADPD